MCIKYNWKLTVVEVCVRQHHHGIRSQRKQRPNNIKSVGANSSFFHNYKENEHPSCWLLYISINLTFYFKITSFMTFAYGLKAVTFLKWGVCVHSENLADLALMGCK